MNSKLKAVIAVGVVAGVALAAAILKRALAEPKAGDEKARDGADTFRDGSAGVDASRGVTRDELYAEAKRLGIPGRSKMTKAQLQAALAEARR